MKSICFHIVGHLFPILFVISQFITPSTTYISSSRDVKSSIGNELVSTINSNDTIEENSELKVVEDNSSYEETSYEEASNEDNTSEVIVDKIVSDNSYENVSYNTISIDSIYSNYLMNDDGSYFYLDHNINGVYDNIGVPFVDYRTDFSTRKTIVYSHSSKSGNGPFQVLQNYMDPSFYWSHPIITINYNGIVYRYQIFSVYVSLADSEDSDGLEYFYRTYYSDSGWNEAINNYKNNSIYDTGVEVSSSDKILILQTCSMDDRYYEKYYRYNLLVMGKLI